jgi:hypothetical protein
MIKIVTYLKEMIYVIIFYRIKEIHHSSMEKKKKGILDERLAHPLLKMLIQRVLKGENSWYTFIQL